MNRFKIKRYNESISSLDNDLIEKLLKRYPEGFNAKDSKERKIK